jgi:hypothetical protein
MECEPLKDKVLICADCNEEFVFTVSAQEYFLEKGFTEEPKRCKSCYTRLKKQKRQEQKEQRTRPRKARHNGSGGSALTQLGNEHNRGNLK